MTRKNIQKLIKLLKQTCLILSIEDTDSSYSSKTPEEIIGEINQFIVNINTVLPENIAVIERLFAPTGDIQEISISSGRGDYFLELASKIDTLLLKLKNKI